MHLNWLRSRIWLIGFKSDLELRTVKFLTPQEEQEWRERYANEIWTNTVFDKFWYA